MLKYNIIQSNKTNNINFNLTDKNNVINNFEKLGFDEIITNEIVDNEKNIFTNTFKYTLDFNFYNGTKYSNLFENNGFTKEEITNRGKLFRYSYFILSIHDTFIKSKQNTLHVGYIPIYLFNGLTTSTLTINTNFEFNRYYIEKRFGTNKFFYGRFYFFNAKNGKITPFINVDQNVKNEERLYTKMYFNEDFQSFFSEEKIILNEIQNIEYINKINNSVDKNKIILPELQNDKIFKTDGSYFDIM